MRIGSPRDIILPGTLSHMILKCTFKYDVGGNILISLSDNDVCFLSNSRLLVPPVEQRPSIWGECPPKFATKPNRVIVREGQTGKFSCKITGRPQPQVTWSKVRLLKSSTWMVFKI